MRIHTSAQGTEEWFGDRAGVISASRFALTRERVGGLDERQAKYVAAIRSGMSVPSAMEHAGFRSQPRAAAVEKAIAGEVVGDFTNEAKEYAFKLAVERISGVTLDKEGFKPWQAERGNILEEDCRLRHEADIGVIVDPAGFITTDCGRFGCSADSLVLDDGGGEYKAFLAATKLRPIIIEGDWGSVSDQVQGCLWITEREWWDQCLYCPPLAPINKDFIRKRTYRDEAYIKALVKDLHFFNDFVEAEKEKLLATMDPQHETNQPDTKPDFVMDF